MFSRLTAISVRMLRHYQEQGVLTPFAVDPFTGHRYYHPDQLVDAHWITRLREAGLPVAQIREVMADRDDPERLSGLLSAHAEHLRAEHARLGEMSAARDVIVATLHGSYDGVPEATAVLGSYVAAHDLRTGPMFNIYRVSPAQDPDPAAWVTDVCLPVIDA
ncbi:MerR family transcriptional regulator [Actinomyces slackii]|nr:MerR family transcriptional regulator [Actinomyces slackii]